MEKQTNPGFKNAFLIHSIVMAVFASIYLFIPVFWGNLTGCLSNQVPQVFRLFGIAILGYGIGSFLAYLESSWEKVKITAQLNCLVSVLFTLVILLGILLWGLPSIAWMYFGVMFVFSVVFCFLYMKK